MRITVTLLLCLAGYWAAAQNQIPIGTFSSSGTDVISTSANYKLYSVMGQPAAIGNPADVGTKAGLLHTASFVTIDNQKPAITYSAPTASINDGAATFNASITDNIAVNTARMWHRPITSAASAWDSAALTVPATGNVYAISIGNASWYDGMGMEYYFTASDASGNRVRMPTTGSYYVPQKISSFNVPNLPFGNLQTNYRMVAFPFDMGSPANQQVTNIYKNIGLNDSTQARMYHYDPATSKYKEFSKGGFSVIERGKAYWLLTKAQVSLAVPNVTAPPENRKSLFTLTLKPGWNQVGNPYPVNISWNDVQTLNNNPNVGKMNIFADAYTITDVLAPLQGGFVKNTGTTDINIVIPFQGQTQVGGRTETLKNNIASEDWNISLHVKQDDIENHLGGFGMHPSALSGADWFDNYNPPAFISMPEVHFTRNGSTLTFSNDVVTTQEFFQWHFNTTGEEGKTTELLWDKSIQTNQQQLYLLDEQLFTITDMLAQNRYAFTQRKTNRFSIFYGSNAYQQIRPHETGINGPYPNPVSGNLTTSFKLAIPESPEGAYGQLQVFDATGQVISTENKKLDPGIHELTYSFGEGQRSGLYFYRISIQSATGTKVYSGKIILP